MEKVLKTRLVTGIIFGAAVIALILSGKYSSTMLFAMIGIFTGMEYMQISGASTKNLRFYLSIALLLLAYISAALTDPEDPLFISVILISLMVYAMLFVFMLLGRSLPHSRINSFFVLIYPGLSVFPAISHFYHTDEHPYALILGFFAILWVSDSGAYFVGRKIGKHKVLPAVSPGKTWEGVIGAGVTSIIVAIMVYFLSGEYSLAFWILAALVIWITGTAGDFTESALKRQFSVKDSGTMLPGHGGFLDRFDSLIFALPFVYLLLRSFNYI